MSDELSFENTSSGGDSPDIPQFLRGWINTPLGYLAIIAVTALVFAIGGVLEYEYGINSEADDLIVYSLILSATFAVGIFVVLYSMSLITPKVSMMTIGAVIGVNTLLYLAIALIDDPEFIFSHAFVTSFVTLIADDSGGSDTLMTNIWVVRVVQAALIALVISELNMLFRASDETRLNIGLTIAIFVGFIIFSLAYVELMEGAITSSLYTFTPDENELRLKLAGSGAAYGGAVATMLLVAYKMAYNSKSSMEAKPLE